MPRPPHSSRFDPIISDNEMKYNTTLCGQIADFLDVKAAGTYGNHYLKELTPISRDYTILIESLIVLG
jgi:hypothetical protein